MSREIESAQTQSSDEENGKEVNEHVVSKIQIESWSYSRYYAEACNEWRGHLRGLAPGLHCAVPILSTSQRWRVVGDAVGDLTDPGFEPWTSRTDSLYA